MLFYIFYVWILLKDLRIKNTPDADGIRRVSSVKYQKLAGNYFILARSILISWINREVAGENK